MKSTEEIYSIRFNKLISDRDIHFTTYSVGVPIFSYNSLAPLVPESIVLNPKTNKITVTFNNREKHILSYSDDVELFIREKDKNKDNGEKISKRSED